MYSFKGQLEGQQEYFDLFVEWLKNRNSVIEVSDSNIHYRTLFLI